MLDIAPNHNQVAGECQNRKLLFSQFQIVPAESHQGLYKMEQFLFAGLQMASQNLERKITMHQSEQERKRWNQTESKHSKRRVRSSPISKR
jgi:hypothetical protein